MNDAARWQETNNTYWANALTWLRLRLARSGDAGAAREEEQAAADRLAAEKVDPAPALLLLSRRLGLTPFERDVLLLCAAAELDTRIASLCAEAQHDPARPYPTFALALAVLPEPFWSALSPGRPLRYWRLLEIHQNGPQPLTASPLRIDERILHYLKGLNYLDDRLAALVRPVDIPGVKAALPASQRTVVERALHHLRQPLSDQRLPVLHLLGADTVSKQAIAWHTAAQLQLHLYRVAAEQLPVPTADLDTLARLWERESLLVPLALYLDAQDVEVGSAPESAAPLVHRFLERTNGVFFLDTRDPWLNPGWPSVPLDVMPATAAEQRAAWATALGDAGAGSPQRLADQFSLSVPTIHHLARTLQAEFPHEPDLYHRLWDACLQYSRPRLDQLAQRLTPQATWDDLVLPPEQAQLLRQIAAQVRQRGMVYEQWGFRGKTSRGLGLSVLFAGESGTGKTLAAEVLAHDLRLDLYRIDLSAVTSKYIGETEKNLRRLFDAAENGGVLLFFDEADALFGKRSEVKDSHDRYANLEINYLLQRMEVYQGLAILATNLKSALDPAFLRRLRFVVAFPFPGAAERKAIWQRVFPAATPRQELDWDRLARFNLTGGSIHNAALNAAFQAAGAGSPVTLALVLDAIRAELRKLERPINEADFRLPLPSAEVT